MHHPLSAALNALKTRQFWLRQLKGLLIGVALAMVVLYFMQRSLFYQGTQMSSAEFAAAVDSAFAPGTTILEPFKAIVVEPPAGQPVVAVAILFHGNAGLGGARGGLAPVFGKRGIRLILAEYPGYGPREGETTEESVVSDARALYAEVLKRYPGVPVMLVGESLGTGPATLVAANPAGAPPPSRLVLLTPYRSMAETAARTVWMLPVRYLVKDVFDVEAALPRFTGPLSILVAGQDEVLGAAQGRFLGQQRRAPGAASRAYVELPASHHNDWRFDMTSARWTELLGYAEQAGKAPNPMPKAEPWM
jgi:pimeloyl-ACP methyl ester carboxylesterase